MATLAVIDYGGSNLRSVYKALQWVAKGRAKVTVSGDPEVISRADRVVFPGQGAIGDCMSELKARGLDGAVREAARNKPFFGICLGLQSLLTESEEDGGTEGFDLFAGAVKRFPLDPPAADDGTPRKVPHMGWNNVAWQRPHPIIENVSSDARFYFVHSYYVQPSDPAVTLGKSEYINEFTAALAHDNIFATQFHPEKSAAHGLRLLENFVGWDGIA
ncbi:MAG: imidazole glycerol phosphate synthase subunit HisH [Pseudomonadota bacterium]